MASNKITPPTNLWGPTTTPTSSQIPDNVIISSDNSSSSGASSVATNSLQKEQTQQQHAPLGQERAIHRINLSSIKHNYNCVQTSAARQQCQVIVVVKADAYGRKRAMSLTSLQYCTYYLIIKLTCYLTFFLHVYGYL